MIFKCPKCDHPLDPPTSTASRVYRCENNHCFDQAKEGYVNLHLVEKKKSKNPGDDAEMLRCRRAFLNRGHYQNFASAIANKAFELSDLANARLLDIGCGEGYYLEQVLTAGTKPVCGAGVDLSKHAVRFAAKRKMSAQLAVASAYDLPFFSDEFDLAISVFAPLCPLQTRRVLKPQGVLIMVGPGPQHLAELAAQIYSNRQDHQGNFATLESEPGFTLLDQQVIDEQLHLAGEDVTNLLRMTPYYWYATAEQQQRIASLPTLSVRAQFNIHCYRVDGQA